jgi:hypothetical protein
VVVVGVLVADTDDAKLYRICRLLPSVCPPFELDLHGYVDDLPSKISQNVPKTTLRQGNGARAMSSISSAGNREVNRRRMRSGESCLNTFSPHAVYNDSFVTRALPVGFSA